MGKILDHKSIFFLNTPYAFGVRLFSELRNVNYVVQLVQLARDVLT